MMVGNKTVDYNFDLIVQMYAFFLLVTKFSNHMNSFCVKIPKNMFASCEKSLHLSNNISINTKNR